MEKKEFGKILSEVREQSPLVHNITNYVVMNNTANALLSIGASPVMAHAIEEAEDITSISSAFVFNIGTLSEKWIEAGLLAGKRAGKLGKPVIFDPVGAGASKYRTDTCTKILEEIRPDIIRGNASEIMALVNSAEKTKGVDSTRESDEAVSGAEFLAENFGTVVVISGASDYVVSRKKTVKLTGGNALMPHVTGMGCTATAIIGAFAGVRDDMPLASAAAMAAMSTAGDIAGQTAEAPGSFQVAFLDALYKIRPEDIESKISIEVLR